MHIFTTLTLAVCSAVFAATATFEAYALKAESDAHKAAKSVFVCFDGDKQSMGDHFTDCRTVQIYAR